jgi:hypothetical protein
MAAAIHGEGVLLLRACREPHCHALFFICSHCDRGHCYCSEGCRRQARLRQRRCANGRHQRSEEGRLDHRDRQREYRLRRQIAAASVTDHGSISITPPAYLSGGRVDVDTSQPLRSQAVTWWPPRCRICGRVFRYVNPYPPIPQRK